MDVYKIGDEINVGYYGGYKHSALIKTTARVYDISNNLIYIRVRIPSGGTKKMFGYENELSQMEENWNVE